MSRPTLAVCIPAYNAANLLPRLLRSVNAQTLPFDEVLVHDDCSTDDTAKVAAQFEARVIRSSQNVGCSAGKNRLLADCTSDWVHFHDADDELLPNFTTLAHKWIGKPDAPDVVLFDYEYRDNDTGALIARSDFRHEDLAADPVRYAILNQINPFCGAYRRTRLLMVGGYDVDPEILYNEDVAFHCKLAIAGFSFGAEKAVSIINYRVDGSMSGANSIKCLKAHVAVMSRIAESVGRLYPEEIARRLWAAATGLAANLEWQAADSALAEGAQLFPGIPRGQSAMFSSLCRIIGVRAAFRLRVYVVRATKPQLR